MVHEKGRHASDIVSHVTLIPYAPTQKEGLLLLEQGRSKGGGGGGGLGGAKAPPKFWSSILFIKGYTLML